MHCRVYPLGDSAVAGPSVPPGVDSLLLLRHCTVHCNYSLSTGSLTGYIDRYSDGNDAFPFSSLCSSIINRVCGRRVAYSATADRLDLWSEGWVQCHATADIIEVRPK